jgi:hypothetical protein
MSAEKARIERSNGIIQVSQGVGHFLRERARCPKRGKSGRWQDSNLQPDRYERHAAIPSAGNFLIGPRKSDGFAVRQPGEGFSAISVPHADRHLPGSIRCMQWWMAFP